MGIPVKRYEQISSVLVKYGFESTIKDVLPKKIPRSLLKRAPEGDSDAYRRVRLAIQELGPTFIKFAQIISTRRDVLPPGLINELKELTDKVDHVGFDRIKPIIEQTCGPLDKCFEYVEEVPFAAASLSQAHLAKLKDGTVIVLKVQRPGIKPIIETDLEILKMIAVNLEKTRPDLAVYSLSTMVQEFSYQILAELDFVRDGKNAEIAAMNMAGVDGVRVPKIYWDYTGPNVLAMEYIKGIRLDRVDALKAMDIDTKEIAHRGFRVFMKQIFEDGFFHGDPHPGNMLVTPEGELVILDWGLVGVMRPEKRDQLLQMMLAIVDRDADALINVLQELGVSINSGSEHLKDDLYLGMMATGGAKSDASSFEDVVTALRRYHVRIPGVAMLMIKDIIMLDGEGRLLDPDFDFVRQSQPIVAELAARRLTNGASVRKACLSLVDSFQSTVDLPRNVNDAFKAVSSGQFTLRIAHDDLDRLSKGVDQAAYKVLLGMVVASIIVGLSLVVVAVEDMMTHELFLIVVVAYILAILAGIYSVYHMIRNK